MITKQQYLAYVQQGFNRIPLVKQCVADLDTPLSIYLKLANTRNTFLLESVVDGDRSGRYSYIGLPTNTVLQVFENRTQVIQGSGQAQQIIQTHVGNPLDFLESFYATFNVAPIDNLPRFFGGLVGYFGYDSVRYIEPILASGLKQNDLGVPDILLMQTDRFVVIDNLKSSVQIIVLSDPSQLNAYEHGCDMIDEIVHQLRQPIHYPTEQQSTQTQQDIVRSLTQSEFIQRVDQAKRYIAAGDVMQVVLGQRVQKSFPYDALSLYRALRSVNPSPYLFYYHFGDFQVVGSSPEILVRQDYQAEGSTKVTLRPIAGTRPRGINVQQDQCYAQELLADPKEIAEHIMLIDLARNDLGRIAQVGSVQLTEKMVIERYSHVMHIVSNVQANLLPSLSAMNVFKATFPAGTLSGAPKIRAMQIVDELEPTKRGIYGGACGYLSYNGNMDLAIAIRTGVVKNNMLYVQAGAGIVADSNPESEWQETENKARAVLKAAELVEQQNAL